MIYGRFVWSTVYYLNDYLTEHRNFINFWPPKYRLYCISAPAGSVHDCRATSSEETLFLVHVVGYSILCVYVCAHRVHIPYSDVLSPSPWPELNLAMLLYIHIYFFAIMNKSLEETKPTMFISSACGTQIPADLQLKIKIFGCCVF